MPERISMGNQFWNVDIILIRVNKDKKLIIEHNPFHIRRTEMEQVLDSENW